MTSIRLPTMVLPALHSIQRCVYGSGRYCCQVWLLTEYHLEKKDKERFTQRETFVARMLTFLTMAIAQSLIVTLGNMFLLGVDVHNPVYSVLFALLVGLAFMMIVYVLAGLFGNVGKGIAIIILVLSISGGGGNYPIQVSGKFFQFINPLLPFTHAVNLLRNQPAGSIGQTPFLS